MEISTAKGGFEIFWSDFLFAGNQKSHKQNNREKKIDFKDARGTFRTHTNI